MKLLLDQNLSHRLCELLAGVYEQVTHVIHLGLDERSDRAIWEHAKTTGHLIVSKDTDFEQLALINGPPPKVIWLRTGNCTTARLAELLRTRNDAIAAFAQDPDTAFLVLSF